jgi:glycosyltransferase involved in cell wall biosynthesis
MCIKTSPDGIGSPYLPLRMLILLDCRPLQYAGPDSEKARLIFSVAAALSRDRDLQWLLLADHTCLPDAFPLLPGQTLLLQRALPGRVGWRIWYDWQIPRLVKKRKVGLVMLTGGVAAGSMPASQCLWMPERANPKEGRGGPPLYAGRLMESLHRAETVFCFSGRDRDWLVAREKQAADKLVVLHPSPVATLSPLSTAERESLKAEFAQGKEYFFADATATGKEGVIHLLKAFSLFKKRQRSNLQLVVMGTAAESLKKRLESYKYREEVHWCPPSADRSGRLTAGAYAAIFPFDGDSLGTPVLNAWKAAVPVLVTAGGPLHELAGDGALSAAGADPAVLAAHLMSVYKDEALRNRLIGRGQSRLTAFDAEQGITAVRGAIRRNIQ